MGCGERQQGEERGRECKEGTNQAEGVKRRAEFWELPERAMRW